MPSALNVSVAVMQVVMPGSVESIAVSSVQSINAPFDRRNRRVGRREAATVGVTVGRSNPLSACGEPSASSPIRVRDAENAAGSAL